MITLCNVQFTDSEQDAVTPLHAFISVLLTIYSGEPHFLKMPLNLRLVEFNSNHIWYIG